VSGEGARFSAPALKRRREFSDALAAVDSALEGLCAGLTALAERSEGLARCADRAGHARTLLERWRDDDRADRVRWVEVFGHSLHLNATPLSVADVFRRQLEGHPRAWIFASATLSVSGDFSHYRSEMGLEEARTACWDSPFDYAGQALLYIRGSSGSDSDDTRGPWSLHRFRFWKRSAAGLPFVTTLRAMRLAHERCAKPSRGARNFPAAPGRAPGRTARALQSSEMQFC
jgi:ATP-dependent DNA helicase DinG